MIVAVTTEPISVQPEAVGTVADSVYKNRVSSSPAAVEVGLVIESVEVDEVADDAEAATGTAICQGPCNEMPNPRRPPPEVMRVIGSLRAPDCGSVIWVVVLAGNVAL